MIYYFLLALGAYSAGMAAIWVCRVVTDGRLYYYLSLLSATLKARATRFGTHQVHGRPGARSPWGW
jgi:hypothetical protein